MKMTFPRALLCLLGLVLVAAYSGCMQTAPSSPLPTLTSEESGPVRLREGDVIRIAFPGAANLDTTQSIRRDGRVTMPIIGEVLVIGKTPSELEKLLLELYANQIVSKEIQVTVMQSTFPIFVNGAVQRPGKVVADRPMTPLEAIMEAGGFDLVKGDLTRVTIIRMEGTQTKHYYIDLKATLEGKPTTLFYLKPSDIVYVPERFSLF